MVEPIGAVTGLVGACDVIARSTLKLITYISEVRAAPKDIERVNFELEALEAVISALQGFLKSARVTRTGFTETAAISVFVEKCRQYIVDLEQRFAKSRAKSPLLWPISGKPEVEKTIQNLQRFTNLFHTALSINGWEFFCKAAEEAKESMRQELKEWQHVRTALLPIVGMRGDVQQVENQCQVIISMLELFVVEDIPSKLRALEKNVLVQEHFASQKERQELLDWLSKDDFLQKHRHVLGLRHKDTSAWIINSSKFSNWMTSPESRILWCHGIPGCGKTVMFSTMVEYLRSKQSLVAAVYFDYKDTSLHDFRSVLAGIFRQLLETVPDATDLYEVLRDLKQSSTTRGQSNAHITDLVTLFQQVHQLGYTITLCFDALDEIPDNVRATLLKWLAKITTECDFKVLLMSRSNVDLKLVSKAVTDLEVIATDADLKRFLDAKIDDTESDCLSTAAPRLSSLRAEIICSIVSRARGMFLLADLQFAHLEGAVSEREIKDLLREMPQGIDEQYMSYFERIKVQRQGTLALRAIAWVHLCPRALAPGELLEALSVRDGDLSLDPSGMARIETIIGITGGLIVSDTESNQIRLVHETLQGFLKKFQSVILSEDHLSVSETLSTYLNFKAFDAKIEYLRATAWTDISWLSRNHKLLNYAFLNWGYHVNEAGAFATSAGRTIARRVSNSPLLLELITLTGILGQPLLTGQGFLPLHVATLWKCPLVVLDILQSPCSLHETERVANTSSKDGLTPLHLVAIIDDAQGARTLIEHGASVETKDRSGRTAIYWAAARSSTGVLGYLASLKTFKLHGMVDIPDVDGASPLHAALRRRNIQTAESLIELGADARSRTTSGQYPLHYAVQFAPEATHLLLVDPKLLQEVSSNGRNALLWACVLGDEKCIATLLQAGAVLHVKDKNGATPLHILAQGTVEQLETAKLLLSNGALPDETEINGLTPLHISIEQRHFATAEQLLLHGADANKVSKLRGTTVQIAAMHPDFPDKLWALIGDVNAADHAGQSALHRATKSRNAFEVETLLSHGANTELRNAAGETALHLAVKHFVKGRHTSNSKSSKSDVISVLLRHGASVNARSSAGLTPIHEALKQHSDLLLRLLCASQPDITPDFPDGQSLILFCIASSQRESLACLSVLLKYGADANGSPLCESPLIRAVQDIISNSPFAHLQDPFTRPHQSSNKELSRRRSSSMTMESRASTNVDQAPPCPHPRCDIVLRCKKIHCLLDFGANPHARDSKENSPADALSKYVAQNLGPAVYTNLDCEVYLKTLAYVCIQDPSKCAHQRVHLSRSREFEWDDSVSLLDDVRRPRNGTFLRAPDVDQSTRFRADTEVPSTGTPSSETSFRRPTFLESGSTANLRSYDQTRHEILGRAHRTKYRSPSNIVYRSGKPFPNKVIVEASQNIKEEDEEDS